MKIKLGIIFQTALSACCVLSAPRPAPAQNTVVVDAAPAHVANSFSPISALGGAIDRLRAGDGAPAVAPGVLPTREEVEKNTDVMLSPPVLQEILGAGWQAVTYRQNTELTVEGWHWNPTGVWSNAEKQEGYFTGSTKLGEPIRHSFGYPLPHRGFTLGDGTGWSRLTDGDAKSYWKSNPYLTRAFTGEDDALHPQWVMIDLGSKVPVNAIRIAWAEPYARKYAIQFWTGEIEPFYDGTLKGTWQEFPAGRVTDGQGGTATLKLVSWNVPVRYIRIWMTQSSNTCDSHGAADPRNCVGYAINELYVGTIDANGAFTDVVKHLPSREQTVTWPSSVDPWHASTDVGYSKGDQIGFDLFFTSGITRGLPTMVPIAMLYSTPEDAAAEIAYLYARHYPISWIEMGEEADGQHMLPEDYAALYLQFATAIHRAVPEAKLGGPPFEGTAGDVEVWPDAAGKVSWLGRFLDYLKARGRLTDFTFFSFEHYPFQEKKPMLWSDLYSEPELVRHILQVWKDDGLPQNVPFFMTEGNSGEDVAPTDVKGGLWLADYVGSILTGGASGTFYFHYMPTPGRMRNFLMMDKDYHVMGYPPQYLTAQLITKEWVQPVDAEHRIFRASSDVTDAAGNVLVTAYAVQRPDGQWSVMLVNKDHDNSHDVKLVFAGAASAGAASASDAVASRAGFHGEVQQITFGAAEYAWSPDGGNIRPDPDGPASKSEVTAGDATVYTLPKASVTVLRGRIN